MNTPSSRKRLDTWEDIVWNCTTNQCDWELGSSFLVRELLTIGTDYTRGSSTCIELECLQEETGQLDGPEVGIKSYRLPSLLTVTVTDLKNGVGLFTTCALEIITSLYLYKDNYNFIPMVRFDQALGYWNYCSVFLISYFSNCIHVSWFILRDFL